MDKTYIVDKTFFPDFQNKPYSLVTKPGGSLCNLNCKYCFYLEKQQLYSEKKSIQMADDILEEYVYQYINSQPASEVIFVWQGGEPCLMGIDFYKKALVLQQKYAAGKQIENSFQTNGTLLDDEWCRFFSDNHFLIGISIDGPKEVHDKYRLTKNNGPTFNQVIKAIELLRKHKVEFNTLTTINNFNVDFPLEIYEFMKSIGSRYMQFMPVVERISIDHQKNGLRLVSNEQRNDVVVTDWSVDALKYGKFLTTIFDEWVKKDVGQYFVQMFDATLANWVGMQPGVCIMSERCGKAGVIEHNGDVYSCDHFVFPEYYLGNIAKTGLAEMMNSATQQLFGDAKFDSLPGQCRKCTHLTKCWGECPKNRFLTTNEGEYGLNYLCEGLIYFFSHVTPAMDFMANEFKNKRSPANVMNLYNG